MSETKEEYNLELVELILNSGDKIVEKELSIDKLSSLVRVNGSKKLKKDYINHIVTMDNKLQFYIDNHLYNISVKDLIDKNIPFSSLIKWKIPLEEKEMLIDLQDYFKWKVDLTLEDKKGSKCLQNKSVVAVKDPNNEALNIIKQGLYMLCVDGYIVKLGSFAETQGIKKRIDSFGGGCHDTGSATNKWFQKYIMKCIEDGHKCYFRVYFHEVKTYQDVAFGEPVEIIPYVIRQIESILFDKYLNKNHNIPPIFGKNCT